MIRSFDCHLVHKLQAVKQQDPVRSWRGIIMATLVIVLITGIIAISVLSVTPSELNIFSWANLWLLIQRRSVDCTMSFLWLNYWIGVFSIKRLSGFLVSCDVSLYCSPIESYYLCAIFQKILSSMQMTEKSMLSPSSRPLVGSKSQRIKCSSCPKMR